MSITPDRFRARPLGYLKNQLGHAALGWAAWTITGWPVAVLAVLYLVVIEGPQIAENRAEWVVWDSAEDTLHVTAGALIATGIAPLVAVPWAIFLGLGALGRYLERSGY